MKFILILLNIITDFGQYLCIIHLFILNFPIQNYKTSTQGVEERETENIFFNQLTNERHCGRAAKDFKGYTFGSKYYHLLTSLRET